MDCVFWSGFDRIVFYVKKSWGNGMKNKKKSPLENSFFTKNHKGELTTQQIVGLVILITSFAVILFFLLRLNLGETTDKEICHNSVLMKSKSVLGGELDCKTNYVCISGGGKCEGINPTITKKIDLSKPNAKNETMKAIADEMADCWWMFGEGKVNYVGKDIVGYHCAICSIIKFDEEIQLGETTYEEFYNYLAKTKKDKTQTYLKYLYDVNSLEDVKSKLEVEEFKFEETISINEQYAVVTGLNVEVWPQEDMIVYPSFVKSSEVKDKTECGIFDITKA